MTEAVNEAIGAITWTLNQQGTLVTADCAQVSDYMQEMATRLNGTLDGTVLKVAYTNLLQYVGQNGIQPNIESVERDAAVTVGRPGTGLQQLVANKVTGFLGM